MVRVVNIVASGRFGRELDLASLAADIRGKKVEYDPENFPGLQLKLQEKGPLIMIFSSGSYTIMGAKSEDQLPNIHRELIRKLAELEIEIDANGSAPVVRNLICKGELGRRVDLNALTAYLGFEHVEYEPEQSPFVYFWPKEFDCLITIPSNGEVIITGVTRVEEAESALASLSEELSHMEE